MGRVPIPSSARRAVWSTVVASLALASAALAEPSGVSGRVLLKTTPVAAAQVYAYQLVEKSLQKVSTDEAGRFLFAALPAGVYKLIAHKSGFAPAVTLLQRDADDEAQFVELRMAREEGAAEDFWSVRSQIPSDVLREIDQPEDTQVARLVPAEGHQGSEMLAEVSAITGVEEVKPESPARVSGGRVGVMGNLGKVKLFLRGDYQTLESESDPSTEFGLDIAGRTRSVALNVQTPNQGVFDVSSYDHRLLAVQGDWVTPVEASQYRLNWSREVGTAGLTTVRAYYFEQSGLFNKGWVDPMALPIASRTVHIEGDYSRPIADRGSIRAGLRLRERTADFSPWHGSSPYDSAATRFLDAYGSGDWELQPRVVVQYGLFTTLRDGTVSLTPRGGFTFELPGEWRASIAAAERFELSEETLIPNYLSLYVDNSMTCVESDAACYELSLMHGSADGNQFAVGGSLREIDSTVRVFFSQNFFEHTEGLFLVPGDRLPELHASLRRRLSDSIVAKFTTSLAEGGGGEFLTVERQLYDNSVSYLATTLDTTFEASSTGVFLAFHRVEQTLDPVNVSWRAPREVNAGLERLELVVSQNLSAIWDFSTDWAVRVGMELARGASFFHSDVDPEALRRRIMTGVAVRF